MDSVPLFILSKFTANAFLNRTDFFSFVKLHFSKLVTTVAKVFCNFLAALIDRAQLGIQNGSVEDVSFVTLTEIGHVNRQIHALLFTNVSQKHEAFVKSLEFRKITVGRILRKYHDIITAFKRCDTFTQSGYQARVAVGGN